jgi:hypothetical protein
MLRGVSTQAFASPLPLLDVADADVPDDSPSARGAKRFALPFIALLAAAVVGYLLIPKGGVVPSAPAPAPIASTPARSTAEAPAPSASDSGAAAASDAASSSGPASEGGSSLDRLALDLIARERKLQEARDAQRAQIEQDRAEAAAKAKEALAGRSSAAASTTPTTVIAPPAPPSQQAIDAEARTRALELEVARLRAESEARQRQEDESAKARALAAAEKEVAAQNAEAERERQAKAIATARKTCSLPAMDLSVAGNLNYFNALSAPGATKTSTGAIRLPPVEVADGKTAVYEITPDSCAHKVR